MKKNIFIWVCLFTSFTLSFMFFVISNNRTEIFSYIKLIPQNIEINEYDDFAETVNMMINNYDISDDSLIFFDREKHLLQHDGNILVSGQVINELSKNNLNGEKLYNIKDFADEEGYDVITDNSGLVLVKKFATKRLILKTQKPINEFYGAVQIASYENIYVLQYNTVNEAKYAYDMFTKIVECVEIDEVRLVQQNNDLAHQNTENLNTVIPLGLNDDYSYTTWGAEVMGVPEYSKYLSDLIKAQNNNITQLPEVVVAVFDTGIDTDHPWFKNRFLYDNKGKIIGANFTNEKNSTGYEFEDLEIYGEPYDGHGTHCAGIICDMTLSNVKILPVKVTRKINKHCYILPTAEYLAFNYVLEMKKKYNIVAINMSYGSDSTIFDGIQAEKIKELYRNGVLSVTGAGNEESNADNKYPCHVKCTITVSSVFLNNSKLEFDKYFSNFGNVVDVCAPGDNITFSHLTGGVRTWGGTSYAAPHIAAIIALIKSDPLSDYSNTDVEDILYGKYKEIKTVLDLGDPGKDIYYGYGMPILNNLIPEYVSVYVKTNNLGSVSSPGLYIYFQNSKEFKLKAFPSENCRVVKIYLDGVEVPKIENQGEYKFNLTKQHEIQIVFGIGYKVNHYLEPIYDLNNPESIPGYEEYEIKETEIKYGEVGKQTAAKAKPIDGFTPVMIVQQTIKEKTEVNVYYRRNKYKLTINVPEIGFVEMSRGGEYLYGTNIEIKSILEKEYNAVLWELTQCADKNLIKEFDPNNKIQSFSMPASHLTLTARAYYQAPDYGNIIIWGGVMIAGVTVILILTRPGRLK